MMCGGHDEIALELVVSVKAVEFLNTLRSLSEHGCSTFHKRMLGVDSGELLD